MASVKVAPVAILSDDHEPEAPAIFRVLITGTKPAPAAALAVTLDDVGTGLVALLPVRKFHVAMGWLGIHAGGAGAVVTVREALAFFVVSAVSINRLLVVLL